MRASAELRADAVKWGDVVGELSQLFPLHHQEVGLSDACNMNYRAYEALARSGDFVVVVLRSGGAVVGYWTLLVTPFLHSMGQRCAHTDLVFVRKDFRSRVAWKTLYSKVKEILLARGVNFWFVGSKAKKPLTALLSREGFELEELSFVKRL